MSMLSRPQLKTEGSGPGSGPQAQQDSYHQFPAGLKVLVVDDDPLCLKIVEHQLRRCRYEVTTCPNGKKALDLLRDKTSHFDLVLSDVYMPDMDGFKLLEHIGLELDLPVIMMSSNGETSVVLRGVTHGAVDFLIKPVRVEELRNVWQHVVRRSSTRVKDPMVLGIKGEGEDDESVSDSRQDKKRKEPRRDSEDGNATKKPRVVWSVEMHQQFVQAVNQLGIDKAVPKRILDLMNVEGLTRENVASHLQKYRLYLKRLSGVNSGLSRNKSGKFQPDLSFQALMAGNPGFPAVQYVAPGAPPGMLGMADMSSLSPLQGMGPTAQGLPSLGPGHPLGGTPGLASQLSNMVMPGAAPDFLPYGAPGHTGLPAQAQAQSTAQAQMAGFEGRLAGVGSLTGQNSGGFPQLGINHYGMSGESGMGPGALDVDWNLGNNREVMQEGSGPLGLPVPHNSGRGMGNGSHQPKPCKHCKSKNLRNHASTANPRT
eukprot:jgi/Botrbrau1/19568/Bobra.0035s0057.4